MRYDNRCRRQFDPRVEFRNPWVVPPWQLSQVDVGKHGAGQPKVAGLYAIQVDDRDNAANDKRKLQKPEPLQLGWSQRCISRCEIDRSRSQARDAGPRSRSLINEALT